jgi:hypothetical protein
MLTAWHDPAWQPVKLGLIHIRVNELQTGRELIRQQARSPALAKEIVAVRPAYLLAHPAFEFRADIASCAAQSHEHDRLV